jgi:hypothetical protein
MQLRGVAVPQDWLAESALNDQFRASDQLDGKAGALLGFAGLLAAIAGQLHRVNSTVAFGVGAAILAAFFALLAAFPRRLSVPDAKIFIELYDQQPAAVVTQLLTATRRDNIERNTGILEWKRRWLAAAAVALLAAGVMMGLGMLLTFGAADGC